jgi:Conserved region of unknown function on GLTSCR protein
MQSTTNEKKMSSFNSQSTPNTPASATLEQSHETSSGSIVSHPRVSVPDSTLAHAGPSSWQIPDWIQKEFVSQPGPRKNLKRNRKLTVDEDELSRKAAARSGNNFLRLQLTLKYTCLAFSRLASRLALDHLAVLYPDVDTPFVDTLDVVHRLLPYHVFQLPRQDLDTLVAGKDKGKGRAIDRALHDEIKGRVFLLIEFESFSMSAETKFALECYKRRKSLQDRYNRVKTRAGKVSRSVYSA